LKQRLLHQIEADRDLLVGFLRAFVRSKSPNPPGDTTAAADFVRAHLKQRGVDFEEIAPRADCPNFIASFDTGRPGPHLVLNGHIDVFAVESEAGWTRDPWSGALEDGKIWGRGAADMKCGTTASIFTYLYLLRFRDALRGRLTLTVVSDEETFGPHGARWLMERYTERVLGDCCLNGEPSSPWTVRFGEKGPLWMKFRTHARGGHGAFVHMSENAVLKAMKIVDELLLLPQRFPTHEPEELARALDEAKPDIDRGYGPGAAEVIRRLTVSIGRMQGGVKVNMIPAECEFEADIRVPNGVDFEAVRAAIETIAARHGAQCEVIIGSPPNWCGPFHPMMDHVRANAGMLRPGLVPARVVSPGATDARLWRLRGVPAVVYGPPPHGMGSSDEHVSVDDFLHVVKTHALSAYDYLCSTNQDPTEKA